VAELIARADLMARARASVADVQHRVARATVRLRHHDGIRGARENWPKLATAATTALALLALAVWRRRR
jgi:MYXO-CTERM domain-containing protein